MAQGPRFALIISRWIILAMVAIAVAITTWAVSPISGNSAAPIPIYRPQHLLVY
jgi:F0F1-type ATP synthase assembly protein I